jgi:hypothetical protein
VIGARGESFLATMVNQQGAKHTDVTLGDVRFVDRRVETTNFEIKNTLRRQSNRAFFREQVRKEAQILSAKKASRSVVVGTRGLTVGAAAQATTVGVDVLDLSDFPDIRDLPRR